MRSESPVRCFRKNLLLSTQFSCPFSAYLDYEGQIRPAAIASPWQHFAIRVAWEETRRFKRFRAVQYVSKRVF